MEPHTRVHLCLAPRTNPLLTLYPMKRYAHIIELKADQIETYKALHADVWPEILQKIKECNLQNYSIYLRQMPDGKHYLFSYFEYVGSDYDADMAAMAADSKTQEWWAVCNPCQIPLQGLSPGEWWASTEEVFHCD